MEVWISFYMKYNRLHIFRDVLHSMGEPGRICMMLSRDGNRLLIVPYQKRDFISHKVSKEVYEKKRSMEIYSKKLCTVIGRVHNWNPDKTYCIPGIINTEERTAVFNLLSAKELY